MTSREGRALPLSAAQREIWTAAKYEGDDGFSTVLVMEVPPGLRASDGLYRFFGRDARGLAVGLSPHLFGGDVDTKATE